MRIFKLLNRLIQNRDLFGTNKFFRYKSRKRYQSIFGGIISIFLCLVVGTIFYNRFLECIYKVNIYSTEKNIFQVDPKPIDMSTYPKGKFMAAIQLHGLNLADSNVNYFHPVLYVYETHLSKEFVAEYYDLEPCTKNHWNGTPQISENLKLLDLNHMMCLPMNFSLSIKGKPNSQEFRKFGLILNKTSDCHQNSSARPRCATQAEYQQFFGSNKQHKLQLYFTNFQITPNKPKFINTFLDDRNFILFTETIGSLQVLYVQDFTIKTDESVFLPSEPTIKTGALVEERSTSFNYDLLANYGQFFFDRSLTSRTYERSFQKMYDILSMVGGLFGIIYASLYIAKLYNNSAYSVNLGSELFRPDEKQEKKVFKKYRFLTFFQQGLFNLLMKLGCSPDWDVTLEYNSCENEANGCIDVLYLLQKVTFLESAVSVIMDDHQVNGLHLRERMSISEAKKQRQSVNFKKEMQKIRKIQVKRRQNSVEITSEQNQSKKRVKSSSEQRSNVYMVKDKNNVSTVSVEYEDNFSFFVNQFARQDKDKDKNQQKQESSSDESETVSEVENHQSEESHENNKKITIEDFSKIKRRQSQIGQKINKDYLDMLNIQVQIQNSKPNHEVFLEKQNKDYKKHLGHNKKQSQIQLTEDQFDPYFHEKYLNQILQHKQVQKNLNDSESQNKKSSIRSFLKQLIKNSDVFAAKQLFLFKSQRQHKTLCGGFFSIVIFIALFSLFYGKLVSCIEKTIIYSKEEKIFSNNPKFMQISTAPIENFMVYLKQTNLNLNNPQARYFDFSLKNHITRLNQSNGIWTEQIVEFSLEKCTLDHFSEIPELIPGKESLSYSEFLCFPKGISFSLQGKKTSSQLRTLEIVVKKCKNETNPLRPCDQNYTDYYLNNELDTSLHVVISNTIINSQNQKYKHIYFDERVSFFLSPDLTRTASVYFEDYKIVTDQNIFPWRSEVTETGSRISQSPEFGSDKNIGNADGYASVKFYKSFNSKTYQRSFERIENVFAFIGGIFRIVLACLFIISSYNNMAYEIILSSQLFKPQNRDMKVFKKYGFKNFLIQALFRNLSKLGLAPKWQSTIQYEKSHKQMQNQLDVMFLIKRLEFFQCSISTVLESYEMKGLHLKEKPSIKEVKQKRKAFKLKHYIKKVGNKQSREDTIHERNQSSLVNESIAKVRGSPENLMKGSQVFKSGLPAKQVEKMSEPEDSRKDKFSEDSSNSSQEYRYGQWRINQIVEDIQRLKDEAKEGHRMSQKIMEMTDSNIAGILFKSRSEAKDLQRQESKVKENIEQTIQESVQPVKNLPKEQKVDDSPIKVEVVNLLKSTTPKLSKFRLSQTNIRRVSK